MSFIAETTPMRGRDSGLRNITEGTGNSASMAARSTTSKPRRTIDSHRRYWWAFSEPLSQPNPDFADWSANKRPLAASP